MQCGALQRLSDRVNRTEVSAVRNKGVVVGVVGAELKGLELSQRD